MSLAGVLLPLLLVLCASPLCHGASSHNITDILAAHPEFTDFSAALSSTGVAAEIDRRYTVTVLAVDNAVMATAQRLQPEDLKRVISLHVLLDYLDDAKLSSLQAGFAQVTSLYQASGNATGSAGIVNITTHQGGRVAFTASSSSSSGATGAPPVAAFYEKSVQKTPYDIAILQLSALISSPAVAGVPAPRFKDLLSRNGCGGFAGLINASADAAAAYDRGIAGSGLTVFCPSDNAVAAFNPTFSNLTADAQVSLLLYHGMAAHYSLQSLKAINGAVSTLATDGSKSYNLTIRDDGDTVKLSSASTTAATVTKTLMDKELVAIYLIDAVLIPGELFNGSQGRTAPVSEPAQAPDTPAPAAPATAPATPPPAPVVAPPATAPTPRRRPAPEPVSATAPSPDADDKPLADQRNNGARGTASWTLGATTVAAALPAIVLVL